MNEVLALLKPDAIQRDLVEEIIQRLMAGGNRIVEARAGIPTRQIGEKHYAHLAQYGPNVLPRTLDFLTSGPVMMLALEGSIPELRKLVGATQPCMAAAGTIRGDLSQDSVALADKEGRGLHNLIHASDSMEAAAKELKLWREEFPIDLRQQASDIRQATDDGNELTPEHQHLLQAALDGRLNARSTLPFQVLYARVKAGVYPSCSSRQEPACSGLQQ